MFTGIVEGMGTIRSIEKESAYFLTYCVELPKELSHQLKIGASISNNGCCLTIKEIDQHSVYFDIMKESLDKTNLGLLRVGDQVNIERSVKLGEEIGGHLMSGHILERTPIIRIDQRDNNTSFYFKISEITRPYIFTKGFIGLDGCSLTIGEVTAQYFTVYFIPETLERTLFGSRKVGDLINIEIDAQTQATVETVKRILSSKGLN